MSKLRFALYTATILLLNLPISLSAKKTPFLLSQDANSAEASLGLNEEEQLIAEGELTQNLPLSEEEKLLMSILEKEQEELGEEKSEEEPFLPKRTKSKISQKGANGNQKSKEPVTKKKAVEKKRLRFPLEVHITNSSSGVKRQECFPIEHLSPELQETAKQIVYAALQSDAIYTLVSGIKPISILADWYIDKNLEKLNEDEIEQVFEVLSMGKEVSFVLNKNLTNCSCGQENCQHLPHYTIYVVNSAATKQALPEFQKVASASHLSPHLEAKKLASRVQEALNSPTLPYSLLGYPKNTQDFHHKATYHEEGSGSTPNYHHMVVETASFKLKEEQKLSSASVFSWKIPETHQPSSEETKLTSTAHEILNYYMKHIHSQSVQLGSIEALRNWFDNGNGICSSKEAYRKVSENITPLQPKV